MADRISRRKFLGITSLTGLAAIPGLRGLARFTGVPNIQSYIKAAFRLVDPDTLLNLEFYFIGVQADKAGTVLHAWQPATHDAFMLVRLPQQHIAEEYLDFSGCPAEPLPSDTTSTGAPKPPPVLTPDCKPHSVQTRISGYSFLAFQLFFTGNNGHNLKAITTQGDPAFPIDKEHLLDWNANYLRLVVREDLGLDEPIFSPITLPDNTKAFVNHYPLGYNRGKFDSLYYPTLPDRDFRHGNHINPKPFTAIEAPYRLVLSPELPNHNYSFRWSFSQPTELWMATLKVVPNPDRSITNQNNNPDAKTPAAPPATPDTNSIAPPQQPNAAVPVSKLPMGVALVGTPDDSLYHALNSPGTVDTFKTLPDTADRRQLVELYFLNRSELKATTQKMAFSSLGVSSLMEFHNTLFQQIHTYNPNLTIYAWKQWMSFGRDQEVQVVRQMKDLCLGHTMLLIETTNRRTVDEVSFLDYRQYLMPLEPEKDYTKLDLEDKDKYVKANYKYNTPFKSIRFTSLKPKQIKSVSSANYPSSNLVVIDPARGDIDNFLAFWPLAPNTQGSDDYLEWEYIATDWQDQETLIRRKMYVISSLFSSSSDPTKPGFNVPDLSPVTQLTQAVTAKDAHYSTLESMETAFFNAVGSTIPAKAAEWHQVYLHSEQYLMEKSDLFRAHMENIFDRIGHTVQATYAANPDWADSEGDTEEAVRNFRAAFYQQVQQAMSPINQLIQVYRQAAKDMVPQLAVGAAGRNILEAIYHYATLPSAYWDSQISQLTRLTGYQKLQDAYTKLSALIDQLNPSIDAFIQSFPSKLNFSSFRDQLLDLKRVYCYLEHAESKCKSKVEAFKSQIGIAVFKVETGFEQAGEQFRQKIGTQWENVYKTAEDYYHKANRDISTITTQALIFKSNVRLAAGSVGQQAMDFFHYDATRQQLHSLQGYVSKVNDTVQKEIPLRMAMAAEYLQCQADDALFSVKNNAYMAFAKLHTEVKEGVQAAMRNIGSELGGMVNPEMASDLLSYYHDVRAMDATVQNQINSGLQQIDASKQQLEQQFSKEWGQVKNNVTAEIKKLQAINPANVANDAAAQIEAYLNSREQDFRNQFQLQKNKLVLIGKTVQSDIKNAADQARNQVNNTIANAKQQTLDYFRGLEAKILGSIKLKDLLPVETCLPKMNKTNKSLYYEFITKDIKGANIGSIEFVTNSNTRLVCYFEKSLVDTNQYLSQTRLEFFDLTIFDGRLKVEFKRLEIVSDQHTKNKTNVDIGKVTFQKELAFLQALSNNIKIPGSGIVLDIEPDALIASYTYAFPGISGGAFTLTNLKFQVKLTVPFPTGGPLKPVRASFGINAPDDQFVIAVSIFGGRGHFVLETTPRYISMIDCGLEFGGYLGLNLGIAQGQAYLMAGMRYVYTRDDLGQSSMRFYGYLTCGGSITVFGFITISVCFMLCLIYEQSNGKSSLTGTCSLTLSVKIGFFEKSFSLTFTKTIAGTDSQNKTSFLYRHPLFHGMPSREEEAGNLAHFADYRLPDAGGQPPPQPAPPNPQPAFTPAGWIQYCKSFCFA